MKKTLFVLACALALIVVFLWYPLELFQFPMQNFDTPAHLYAVEKILNSGLSEVLHLSPSGGFYPPLFHIIAAGFSLAFGLFGGVSAAWILGAGIIFPIGMYFLTREALHSSKSRFKKLALLLTPILAVSFLAFPYSLLDVGTLYAYGFAIALLPWLLFFAKKFWRVLASGGSKRVLIMTIVGVIISFALVALAQPRALFFAVPIILIDVIYFIVQQWKVKKKLAIKTLIAGGSTLLLFVAGISFYVVRSLRSDLLWHPENWFEGVTTTHSWLEAILAWLSGAPKLSGIEFISIITIIIIVTALIFAIKKWKNEIAQKFLILYGLFGIIYVFCVSSNSGFAKLISAPWYQNGWRILAVLPIIVIPIFVLAVAKLCEKIGKRYNSIPMFVIPVIMIACITTTLVGVASMQLKGQVVSQATIGSTSLFSQNEYELSQSLELEPNSLILADPTTGANYLGFFTDYEMIFPVINPDTARQQDLQDIMTAFDEVDSEKLLNTVCAKSQPVYFADFGEQSDIFGGEHMLSPWRSFHNQATLNSFVQSGIMQKMNFNHNYNFYKFNCE